MTALDPTPVLTIRREALDRLDVVRERIGRFLDHPTSHGLSGVSEAVTDFVRFEAQEILAPVDRTGDRPRQLEPVRYGHDALVAGLNRLAWTQPGSAEIQVEVHRLRHELLAQADRYLSLRLPRGSLISGR